ncbi:MAG: FHA domain-containing protein [Verrucomicrobiota bacterium]
MKITVLRQGKETVREIALEMVLIGRGGGTGAPDLGLSADPYVSRKHAMLTERHGAIWIEDLGSKLGTTVNGKPIQNRGEWRLRPSDVIVMGETTLRMEPSSPPPTPAPASSLTDAQGRTEFHLMVAPDPEPLRTRPVAAAGRRALVLDAVSGSVIVSSHGQE